MNALKATITSRLFASVLAGATLLTLIGAGSAGAQVMMRVPEGPGYSPGVPAYTRTDNPEGGPFLFHTDEWAAIVFYRTPTCVPKDFNLLDFFDPPPRPFSCPLTVSGAELWDNGPDKGDVAPRYTFLTGFAVPVWFVPWPALQAALTDKVLTMPELESLNPLKGIATQFHELLLPFGGPAGPTAGADEPDLLTITASGVLPDGRSFQYFANHVLRTRKLDVRICFR